MRHLTITVIILLHLGLFLHTGHAADSVLARKVNGEVSYRTPPQSKYSALVTGSTLQEGDSVRTGKNGWAELLLSDGSTITLANNSELKLTLLKMGNEKREGLFNFTQGKVRASVVKLAGKQADFKIKSGTAVAGVKGTEFLMMSAGQANVFFGNEGSVAVSGTGKEQKQMNADTMTQTTRGYEPLDPVNVEPGSPLAEARSTFNTITGATPPTEWMTGDALPEIIGRWNINYSHYLTDRGNYQDALRVLQIAVDLAQSAEIRADALLERGTILGRFLNKPEAALSEFLQVLNEYSRLPQGEIALFNSGHTLYELKRYDQAAERLRQYLATYPSGRYRNTVEVLLKSISGQPETKDDK